MATRGQRVVSDSAKQNGRSSRQGAKQSGKPAADKHESDETASQEPPWWYANADGEEPPNPVDVGTAAQEAVKLAAAVAQWAEQSGLSDTLRGIAEQAAAGVRTAAQAASAAGSTDDDVDVVFEEPGEPPAGAAGTAGAAQGAQHARTTCDTCPICQGIDIVKTMSPEAANGITDALAAVTTAVRQAVDGLGGTSSDAKTKVEHIDID